MWRWPRWRRPFMEMEEWMEDMMEEVRREFRRMERMFEEPFRTFIKLKEWPREPLADIVEEDDHIRVTAELPGMKKEDIKIYLKPRELEIIAERKEEGEEKRGRYHRRERMYRSYHRVFSLPSEVKTEEIPPASYKNGVLEIRLPKVAPVKRHEIKVE
jgi:HSP20 family protein